MKRLSVFSLVVIVSLVLSLAAFAPSSAANGATTRVMIGYQDGKKGPVVAALHTAGAQTHFEFDNVNAVAVTLPQAALAGLQNNPNIAYIEEDAPRYPISIMPSKQTAPVQAVALASQVVPYGVDMVQARDVWDADRNGSVDAGAPTGAGRKICIIDSGFYTGHEDLGSTNVSGYMVASLPWNVDGSGHGTHVAGTIRALNNALGVVGVTPGTVSVYSVRVFGDDGAWAYSSTLVDAANRCASAGANIISMSLGGSVSNRTEKTTFANLFNQGILSIAAAGNDGNNRMSYPASYTSVVSVAAIDQNMTVASFSQYNSEVDIAAPGVGVLSTVPYVEDSYISGTGFKYTAGHIDLTATGSATGIMVYGGLCQASDVSAAWSGKIVLCQRGTNTFDDKVLNVQNAGGLAAAIYNNVSGPFAGTASTAKTIVAISLSMEDGQALVANNLGQTVTVSSTVTKPASGYEYYDGTSMATPHVSAVAALVWSAKPSATAAQVRDALESTALDLGAAGRDNYYGNGLVQAKAAIDALTATSSATVSVADLDALKTLSKTSWKVTVTITVKNNSGAAVSGAVVAGTFNGSTAVSCTTGSTGTCSVSASAKNTITSLTYAVSNITASGYSYNPAGNSDPDGDSNGTTITVAK